MINSSILLCRSGKYSLGGIQRLEEYVIQLLLSKDVGFEEVALKQPVSVFSKICFIKEYLQKVPSFSTVIFFHSGLASVCSFVKPAQSILFTHGIELEKQSYLANLNYVDHVLTNSKQNKNFLNNLGISSVKQVYYPTSIASINSQKKCKKEFVISVSRLDSSDRYKGFELLFDVWDQLGDVIQKELIIVGSGTDLIRLKNYARSLKNGHLITFTGEVDDEKLVELYQQASAFVLLSSLEGQGLVFFEALSYGLPVIALNHTVANEFIRHGENGILLEKEEPYKMAVQLVSHLQNSEKWSFLSEQAFLSFESMNLNANFDAEFMEIVTCAE